MRGSNPNIVEDAFRDTRLRRTLQALIHVWDFPVPVRSVAISPHVIGVSPVQVLTNPERAELNLPFTRHFLTILCAHLRTPSRL